MSAGVSGDFTLSPKQQRRLDEVNKALKEGRNPYSGLSAVSIKSEPKTIVVHQDTQEEKLKKWKARDSYNPLHPIYSPGLPTPSCVVCSTPLPPDIVNRYKVRYTKGFSYGEKIYTTEQKAPFTLCSSTPYYPNTVTGYACQSCAERLDSVTDKHGVVESVIGVAPSSDDVSPLLTSTDQDIRIKQSLSEVKAFRERNHKNVKEVVLEFDSNPALVKAVVVRIE